MSIHRDWVQVPVNRYCAFWTCDKCGLKVNLNMASDEHDHEPSGWVRSGPDVRICPACFKQWLGAESKP